MALVYGIERSPSIRTWATALISTSTDGITGADIVDMGGHSFSGLEISSVCTDANYSFLGGIDSTAVMRTLLTTTGGVITIGTTAANITTNRTILFDPSLYSGIRFLQIMSGTTAAPIANATGASVRVLLSSIAPLK